MAFNPKRSTERPAPKRRANRSYDRAGRLIKMEPSPKIECRIVDNTTGLAVSFRQDGKTTTVFESKKKARVALWKLCETLPRKVTPDQPDRYSIVSL